MNYKKLYNKIFGYEKLSIEYMKKQDKFVYYIANLTVIFSFICFSLQYYYTGTFSFFNAYIAVSTLFLFNFYVNQSIKIKKGLKTNAI